MLNMYNKKIELKQTINIVFFSIIQKEFKVNGNTKFIFNLNLN